MQPASNKTFASAYSRQRKNVRRKGNRRAEGERVRRAANETPGLVRLFIWFYSERRTHRAERSFLWSLYVIYKLRYYDLQSTTSHQP